MKDKAFSNRMLKEPSTPNIKQVGPKLSGSPKQRAKNNGLGKKADQVSYMSKRTNPD